MLPTASEQYRFLYKRKCITNWLRKRVNRIVWQNLYHFYSSRVHCLHMSSEYTKITNQLRSKWNDWFPILLKSCFFFSFKLITITLMFWLYGDLHRLSVIEAENARNAKDVEVSDLMFRLMTNNSIMKYWYHVFISFFANSVVLTFTFIHSIKRFIPKIFYRLLYFFDTIRNKEKLFAFHLNSFRLKWNIPLFDNFFICSLDSIHCQYVKVWIRFNHLNIVQDTNDFGIFIGDVQL